MSSPIRTCVLAAASAVVLCSGCASITQPERRALSIGDFARPPAGLVTDVVEASPEVLEGPEVVVEGEETIERSGEPGDAGRDFVEARREVTSREADGATVVDAASPVVVARVLPPGATWPVEGLVGQVNGRPVFADAFFESFEDRLVQIAAEGDRVEARRALVETVRREFKRLVDSELIVAEAESQLSPEQQQGLFAWLKSIQEETIAERGGSRAAAEASLETERSTTLEEFLQERRDVALAQRLINERVEPRTIVSWRDVTQEYERRRAEFNPPPTIRIGRIRLNARTDADAIARVRQWVADGKDFAAIASELKLPEGGLWNAFDLPPEGIRGLPLSDAVKSRLDGLPAGRLSESFEQRGDVMWLAVIEVFRPPSLSLYDREVQLRLESELKGRREIIERERYISTLRSRWVTDDIGSMERKLLEIAIERYWR